MNKRKQVSTDTNKAILDSYFDNGFNRLNAVRSVKGEAYNYNSAMSLFYRILQDDECNAYITSKRSELKKATGIHSESVLRELMNWAYSDITSFITLTAEEIKELPVDIRRCIASFDRKITTYLPRGAKAGHEVTEEVIKIKLVDKIKAMESISKHIGFYLEDNKQKANKIDIKQLNVNTLNALLQATNSDELS